MGGQGRKKASIKKSSADAMRSQAHLIFYRTGTQSKERDYYFKDFLSYRLWPQSREMELTFIDRDPDKKTLPKVFERTFTFENFDQFERFKNLLLIFTRGSLLETGENGSVASVSPKYKDDNQPSESGADQVDTLLYKAAIDVLLSKDASKAATLSTTNLNASAARGRNPSMSQAQLHLARSSQTIERVKESDSDESSDSEDDDVKSLRSHPKSKKRTRSHASTVVLSVVTLPPDITIRDTKLLCSFPPCSASSSESNGVRYSHVDHHDLAQFVTVSEVQTHLLDSNDDLAVVVFRRIVLFHHRNIFKLAQTVCTPKSNTKGMAPTPRSPIQTALMSHKVTTYRDIIDHGQGEPPQQEYKSLMAYLIGAFKESDSPHIKQSILEICYDWLRVFPEDLDDQDVSDVVTALCELEDVDGMSMDAGIILIQTKVKDFMTKVIEGKRLSRNSVIPASVSKASTASMAQLPDLWRHDAQDIAEKLFCVDALLFLKIQPRELQNKGWTRDNATEVSPNVVNFTNMFNKRSFWATSEVLRYNKDTDGKRDAVSNRTKALETLIDIAWHCLQMNNYFTAFAIYCGITLQPVYRLNKTHARLEKKSKQRMEELKNTQAQQSNYKVYRTRFKRVLYGSPEDAPVLALPDLSPSTTLTLSLSSLPIATDHAPAIQIPYWAVTLKDLFQLEEINNSSPQPGEAPLINFHKFAKQWAIVHDVLVCQTLIQDEFQAALKAIKPQTKFLRDPKFEEEMNERMACAFPEEDAWARSFECEPRNS